VDGHYGLEVQHILTAVVRTDAEGRDVLKGKGDQVSEGVLQLLRQVLVLRAGGGSVAWRLAGRGSATRFLPGRI